ncbi:hypothetical protein RYX36_027691, partial [Vicia faba]
TRALDVLNFTPLHNMPIRIMYSHHDPSIRKSGQGNIFIKNLDKDIDYKALHDTFYTFGSILSCKSTDVAARAVEALNGKKIDDKEWYVGKAQKKSEREHELKQKFEQRMKAGADKYQGENLYVKNLDDSIVDDKLKEMFSSYGTITSCKVMRDPNGISRGSGFVAFSTPEEASRAFVNCMKWLNDELAKKNMAAAILEKKNLENKKEMSKADVALALILLDYAASDMKKRKYIESEIDELKKCQNKLDT